MAIAFAAGDEALAAVLTGTVVDAGTREPLEGAIVTVASERGVDVATTTTDRSGRYAVRLNAGRFLVRAALPGYQPRYHGGGRVRGPALDLGAAGAVNADIALPRAAELAGTAWRPDGRPLHPGYVWLIRRSEPLEYYSAPIAEDGRFRLDDLPPGNYQMRALTYDPVARQLTSPDWDWPHPVALAVGEPVHLDMHLEGDQPEPNWVGLVTDEAEKPVPGVQLMILRVRDAQGAEGTEGTEHVSVRRTDAEGRCQLDELPPGRYRVTTTDVPPPYAPWRNPDPRVRGAEAYARHFEIGDEGQAVTRLRLQRGRTLSVRLRDKEGGDLPGGAGVSLVLWHRGDEPFGGDGFFARPAMVGAGHLEVRGLLPGAVYEVRLADRDDGARWCVAAVTGSRERTLAVPTGGDPEPLEIRLRRCGR